jgi:DHA1 family inner membrane transport protein
MTSSTNPDPHESSPGLPVADLAMVTLARMVMNTAYRLIYPFEPEIRAGLGISAAASRGLIGVRAATMSLASPTLGPLSDRFGRRAMMLTSLLTLAVALVLLPLAPVYGVALAAFVLMGLAKATYDPAVQAHIGDRVPYRQRAQAMGLNELAWSGAVLICVPLLGLLMRWQGWAAGFAASSAAAVAAALGLLIVIRPDRQAHGDGRVNSVAEAWRSLLGNSTALVALAFSACISAANEAILVVYGEWMASAFGLPVDERGWVTGIIGIAELGGELFIATSADRLGKRRLMLTGLLISTVAYAGLPVLGTSLAVALAILFVMFISFEWTIVASIPLISELLPSARGTMMAGNVAALSAGRVLGALLGQLAWGAGGFVFNGGLAALVNLIALGLALWKMKEIGSQ